VCVCDSFVLTQSQGDDVFSSSADC